ncbi:hypothetical protein NLI96_g7724 [Meripilus lineatus]|uniref:Uncharacterized protein n=1 Tax=Meripilus lineatus TaxID=2056292 RepID=A0AAD5YEM8_9APHY|nr:hypothetical protein NLI96_g7724 [Physisporinus lineatus]
MPRYIGEDEPDNSGYTIPSSPYPHPEQAKLRGTFNARRSARLAQEQQGGSSPAGKVASSMEHPRSPTPFPRVNVQSHRSTESNPPRSGRIRIPVVNSFNDAQAGPTTVPRANAFRPRPIGPNPPPNPVMGSSSNPIDVDDDDDSDIEIIDASPSVPMASVPPVSKPRFSPFRMPGGPNVDCNDLTSVYTPRNTLIDAIMEDANESPSSQLPAPDSTRGPVGGSSLADPKNKGKGKSLEPPRPFSFESFSEAIESVARSAEMSRERQAMLANERAEQTMKKHMRHEGAREVRVQEKKRQAEAEAKKRKQEDAKEDAKEDHVWRRVAVDNQTNRRTVRRILNLWKRFKNEVAPWEHFEEKLEMDGASGPGIEELSEMVKKMDDLLNEVRRSVSDAREVCTIVQESQQNARNMCQELRGGRQTTATEAIARLRAEQDKMLADLESGLKSVTILLGNEIYRHARLARELKERLALERRQCAKEEVQAAFATYESKWAALRDLKTPLERHLTFSDVPWPVFGQVKSTNDLTVAAVKEFLLHPARPLRGGSLHATIRSDLRCYHDDKFKTSVLNRVASSGDKREWDKIKEGGGEIIKILLTDRAFKG